MEPQVYAQLSRIEDRHWWHRSRLKLAAESIDRMKLQSPARILDVGCGTGSTTRFLERYGPVVGLDRSPIALGYARGKAARTAFVRGDANQIDRLFAPASFDLITFFNVLYHQWIRDDVRTLRGVQRVLKPGGWVLLTEPAYPVLTRKHDVLGMGKTRYTPARLRKILANAGIDCQWIRQFNALALPVTLLTALLERRGGSAAADNASVTELALPTGAINHALELAMDVERHVFRWLPAPLGVTLLVVGRNTVRDEVRPA